MKSISVRNFGPISRADVEFGDLTIIVGEQASGKSLFLELAKLLHDRKAIVANLKRYNYILGKRGAANLLDIYFGDGLHSLWKEDEEYGTSVSVDGKPWTNKITIPDEDANTYETVFYMPAQRILSMPDGRPKSFSEFDPSCPYVLRQFSETLRVFMGGGLGDGNNVLFPVGTRLKNYQRNSFDETIFHGGKVVMDTKTIQRKMKLEIDGMDMPFMTWSAGQKEFTPLLMGFYCVSGPPVKVIKKEQYKCVVIEEPEMGLHPQAIKAVMMQMLELVLAGYKVVISTHSTVPLEFVWAFNILRQSDKSNRQKALMQLLGISGEYSASLNGIFGKSVKTYYFTRKSGKVTSMDISSLDVGSENTDISEWGGLSQFASEAGEVVSRFCNE